MPRRSKAPEVDYSAAADRCEMILDVLTSDTVGAKTIAVDRAAFHRAIDYFRHRAKKENDRLKYHMPDEEEQAIQLLRMHNICWVWAIYGDPRSMVVHMAVGTSSQRQPELRVV